ncbi:hypothetical protein [uncultured Microscilla sp.]|uniref:hypothetical protein n=1 Tax=uncultured Microscilla sp. TaxID=432653 RepID=UPI00261A00D7|nr:hypothetical protein [uncultured Microscilla sp.]
MFINLGKVLFYAQGNNFAMWLINNWERIVQIIQNIVSSVGKIAMGMLGEAAKFIENTLANFVPLLLDFMARMMRLGNVSARIKKILMRLKKPVDELMAKVMAWIKKKLRGFKKKKKGGKEKEKNKQDGKDTPQSKKVKEKAKQELTRHHNLKNEDQFENIAHNVEKKLKPEGLKDVAIRGGKDKWEKKVYVKASPEHFAALLWDIHEHFNNRVKGIVWIAWEFDNNPLSIDYVRNVPKGDHAEEVLAKQFPVLLDEYKKQNNGQDPKEVELAVRKVPCLNRCNGVLTKLARQYPNIDFSLYYLDIYEGREGGQLENSVNSLKKFKKQTVFLNLDMLESAVKDPLLKKAVKDFYAKTIQPYQSL